MASKETGFSLVRDVCSHSLDCDDNWIIRGMKSGEIGWDDWIIRGVTSLRMDGSGQGRDEDGDVVGCELGVTVVLDAQED